MPRLEDIRDGKFKVGAGTSLSHNGQIYRGQKEINELVARVLPDESEPTNESKAARKLTKSEQRRHDASKADASPAPQQGRRQPSAAATPPAGEDAAEASSDTTDAK